MTCSQFFNLKVDIDSCNYSSYNIFNITCTIRLSFKSHIYLQRKTNGTGKFFAVSPPFDSQDLLSAVDTMQSYF